MTVALFTLEIRFENDVVVARQKARLLASALKFESQDQVRIATAISEIARNTFQYAGGGSAEFRITNGAEDMLMVTFRDRGKGIANLNEIMDGRYVSRTGMGLGIIGAKRLMDHFEIQSNRTNGTTIVLGKKLPTRTGWTQKELVSILAGIEKASQDPYEELKQQNRELLSALQELRLKQEELAQLNRELDETNRGVVALYAELNDKAEFLQRASELKSHFLSNMSHEFRTPLNSITALSQILLDHLDGDLNSEQEKQVRYIRGSAQDLTELVNDLLDLAKVEAGKVTIRPAQFQVEGLFAAMRGMLRPLLSQNSSVNLIFEDPVDIPEIYNDEARVSQILRNFISNALKFTERGEIRVSVSRGHDETVVFSVADTGIGIAPEDQDRIFQEWTQVEGKLQKVVKGTGLGLPLSRKFAELLGGNVYVKSKPGIGSTFFAVIPIKFSGEMEMVQIPEAKYEMDPSKLPVLIVEDNREAVFIYEKYLKDTRYQVVPARNLKEARETLRSLQPAAIILDVLLQGEHSWELLLDLKQNAATKGIPVLVVTVIDNRDRATALGADGFHPKPVERVWLLEQLDYFSSLSPVKRVLIIDDDEVSRYLVKTVLGHSNFRVAEASGGQEGIRKAQRESPDLVMLDLSMPDLSGFEVLNMLKQNPRTAGIPVIIHTSKSLDPDDHRLLHEAAAILNKGSRNQEVSINHFADAFRKAGFSLTPTQVPNA